MKIPNTLVGLALASVVGATSYEEKFQQWMKTHGIEFHPTEWLHRFENFILNDQFIEGHNSKESNFTLGHNAFSHLSFAEFKQQYMGLRLPPSYIKDRVKMSKSAPKLSRANLPASIDWVEQGAVTPVKNQGMCGSCWAFSTTGSVEGAVFVSDKKLVSLSEQELVDCDHDGDMGCGGGLMDHAFNWIEKHGGLCKEEDYTYHANASVCKMKACTPITKVSGFHDVPSNDESELKAAVAQQPVSVAIEADQPEFQFYKSGVFDKSCGNKLDHGVLTVGYGKKDGKKFWKVKNSWGPKWGDEGYIYLARDLGPESGQCGIAIAPSYPSASLIKDALVESQSIQDIAVEELTVDVGSTVSIAQCGDIKSEYAAFSHLSVSPADPKRGKPIHFSGEGVVKTAFDSAHLNLGVRLGGQLIFSHFGTICGKSHISLPLGLGHIDIKGFNCPVAVGAFKDLQVSLTLPSIAPEGDYEIHLTSEHGEDDAKQTVFCVQVKMDLNDADDKQQNGMIEELMALS